MTALQQAPARVHPVRRLGRYAVRLLLAAGAVVSLVPFLWMAIAATHSTSDLFHSPPPFLPGGRLLDNLVRLQDTIGFGRVLLNSVGIAVVHTALSSLISAMCGYGLAKYRFRGRGLLLGVVLATMMIPFQVLLVPLFQMMASVGWIDSYQAVILPFLANSFGILLMRQSFVDFPDELLESARIDGSGELRTFYQVVLPCVRPQLGALVIFTFMAQWNSFIWPLLMLNSEDKYTVPVALNTLTGLSHVDYSGLMLGSLLATLPLMLLFLLFQRQFVAGLLGGAVKG
ncbi:MULTISPECIES: carbohydrate ABC transporter permease [unclassified Streptomyces]|uniref:carbohydrate ABC transporter permease n=1 Tax=unclassified Streptomyces TaxID=2593676 RepID=UPI00225B22BE|nr:MULTISPECIES: carbohydrate ABC transporter permease [unclassified Streptomyces]MCX4398238.1 carbohydrate ABC transporter permease [Streptomyces sp. NBC_01767]MCX5099056.1 carbohydrate ABC transporter permease [Streptomyces sp. NBC_00439]MCX5158592.1 carbohydrate ABC transporter permease [Streptomyces sp. NBC_00305]MCX5217115.1 carbohydrate ABC transporter permease [Streptomyces sp. NBC_00264]WSC31743.1 carbohydrate ABC transporter permease [Streptomyces sp. NBC_01768]